jgi:hypothetical protein
MTWLSRYTCTLRWLKWPKHFGKLKITLWLVMVVSFRLLTFCDKFMVASIREGIATFELKNERVLFHFYKNPKATRTESGGNHSPHHCVTLLPQNLCSFPCYVFKRIWPIDTPNIHNSKYHVIFRCLCRSKESKFEALLVSFLRWVGSSSSSSQAAGCSFAAVRPRLLLQYLQLRTLIPGDLLL